MRRLFASALLLALLAVAAAGCGGDDDNGDAGGTTAEPTSCEKGSLELVTPGKLTIATDNPAFPPWFEGKKADEPWDPTTAPTRKGYEAAVAYAVAEELGFTPAEVEWTVVPFNQIFRPGPKDFDFDVNQVSFSEERTKAVDFSDSYYDVEQAVVTVAGSKIANAATLDDLKDAKLGVQIGTTSYDTIVEVVAPDKEPAVYDTNNDAISALKAKQVDGIVVDYPTSLYVAAVQLDDGKIVGRLPSAGEGEYFGLVTEKGSPLVPCLNQALESLRINGLLDQFQRRWIIGSAPPLLE